MSFGKMPSFELLDEISSTVALYFLPYPIPNTLSDKLQANLGTHDKTSC